MTTDRSATLALIRDRLAPLAATSIDIADDSHRHAGHAGAREGGHFTVTVVAEAFRGMAPLKRHRTVLELVGDLRAAGIHALSVVARVPASPDDPR